jgi:hypothetical protein
VRVDETDPGSCKSREFVHLRDLLAGSSLQLARREEGGTNPRMIYPRLGSKSALYVATLESYQFLWMKSR